HVAGPVVFLHRPRNDVVVLQDREAAHAATETCLLTELELDAFGDVSHYSSPLPLTSAASSCGDNRGLAQDPPRHRTSVVNDGHAPVDPSPDHLRMSHCAECRRCRRVAYATSASSPKNRSSRRSDARYSRIVMSSLDPYLHPSRTTPSLSSSA